MINKIITYLLDPYIWILIIFFYLILKPTNSQKKSDTLKGGLIFLIFILSAPIFSNVIISHLENQFRPINISTLDKNKEYYIVVLGGGFGYDKKLQATNQIDTTTLGRLVEGIRVFNNLPNSKLITTGTYKKHITDNIPPSQAKLIKNAAISLGVNTKKILTLKTPWNTRTEAKTFIEQHGENKNIILVTCATHMPRAYSWFQYYGAKRIKPAPTNFIVRSDEPFSLASFLPHSNSLSLWQKGLKEIIGKLLISVSRLTE